MRLFNRFVFMIFLISATLYSADPSPDAAMSGFQFLEEPTNPELIGLSYSGSALGGMGGFFYNPAKYSLVEYPSFHLEFGRYKKADANKVNFELLVPIKKSFVSFGMRFFSIDDIQEVNSFGDLPYGSFSERGTKISLGSGLEVNEYLDLGLSISGIIHNIHTDYAYSLQFGAGAIGKVIPGKLNVALSIVNFGFATGMIDSTEKFGEGEKLPVNSRLGIAWMDTLKTIDYKILFDVVYRNVWDRDDDFTHRISDRFSFPFGLEVRPVSPLAIRLGKRINMPSEIINLGMGLKTYIIDFDFGIVVNKLIDNAESDWTASFTYRLKKRNGNKKEENKKTNSSSPTEKIFESSVDTIKIERINKDSADIKEINDTLEKIEVEDSSKLSTEFIDKNIDTLTVEVDSVNETDDSIPIQDSIINGNIDSTIIENSEENVILEKEEALLQLDSNRQIESKKINVDSIKVDSVVIEEQLEMSPADSNENSDR